MDELKIGDFNSYFELFVAFTFAYNGLSGFQDYINETSFKNYRDISEKYSESLSKAKLKVLIDSERKRSWLAKKMDLAEIELLEMDRLVSQAHSIFDGTAFRSLFYFTGGIFLSLIILSGFENFLGDTVTFITVALVSILSISYSIYARIQIQKQAKGILNNFDNDRLMKSNKLIPIYSLCFFTAIAIAFLVDNLFSLLILSKIGEYVILKYFITSLKVIFIILFLGISLLPYWTYYNRRNYFINHLDGRAEKIKANLTTIFEDIYMGTEEELTKTIDISLINTFHEQEIAAEKINGNGKSKTLRKTKSQ